MAALGTATGPAKLRAVTDLVKKLSDDLEQASLLPKDRDLALEELKIYGRDPRNADPIFTKEGISMLLGHAFGSSSLQTSHAALRVLANAMVLKPETRQIDPKFAHKACKNLESESWDSEFLLSRILFLSTYGTTVDLKELIDKHELAERINTNLGRHANQMSTASTDPMQDMALVETVNLLFNMTHHVNDAEHVSKFTPAVPHMVSLLWKQRVSPAKPLDPPFGPLINSLLNLDLGADISKDVLYPKDDPNSVAAKLIELLDPSMKVYSDNDLDPVVTPLVGVIMKVYENAPDPTKEFIRGRLLPTAEDREDVLGKGDTLSARLLKNSNNPVAPSLRNAISHLLFDMSDKDASKFVENVGYGFASGFLFENNVPIPASVQEAYSKASGTGEQRDVNPITGQFLDAEKPADLPEMTEEEKEREAERLFVLFERLKKTGIIDVQNPVEAALREGQFRELKDDEVEELD